MTETTDGRARVLVAAASKHGATAEIADRIGETLRSRDVDVTVAAPEHVESVDGYDAVLLGSAVYAGRWLREATDLADRIAESDGRPLVWLFSSGPVGDPPKPEEDPVEVESIVAATSAHGHRLFAGKIDRSVMGFGERAVTIALRVPDGDFRDFDAIAAWAGDIADALETDVGARRRQR